MDLLQLTSLLIVLAGLFGAVNYLFLKLPTAIGILVVSLAASLTILVLDLLFAGFRVDDELRLIVGEIAFSDALLEGMLGLLLFAGALHVKLSDLREQWLLVALMATMGVALSTVIVGFGFSWLTG
ncbi:MAG: sodium:proton antiporter, partial [Rhodobacteraceae bacterium]